MALSNPFRRQVAEAEPSVPLSEHVALANQNEILSEALGDGLASLRREDVGWRKIGSDGTQTFTRAELLEMHKACLAAYIGSPLIGRGLRIRRNYVFGAGMEISARDADSEGDAPVNALIQELVDSPEYGRTLGSAQAREEREVDLGVRGEFFILAIHDENAQTVRPRLVPPAQITDYVTDPDDPSLVLFYKRRWTTMYTDLRFPGPGGQVAAPKRVERVEWHPTLEYRPGLRDRVMLIGTEPVRWDQPIQHCAVNSVTDAPWGIADIHAALDWARGYGEFLENWAKLTRALSRYAWRVTAPGSKAAKVRPAVSAANDEVAATAAMSNDATLEAIPKSGATIDAGSGKPLAGMVAAALDVPVTMLLADPGVTGARATAETLDRPLELTTGARQGLWTDWLKAFFDHVIVVAIEDQVLPADADGTVDVTFPPISDVPLNERLDALQTALDSGAPPLLTLRLMLEALGVEDVDEVLADMQDDDGNFVDPRVAAAAAAVTRERNGAPGSQAAEAYR